MRYRTYTQHDDPDQPAGDFGFMGVDCKQEPDLLTPALCSWAENKRFVTGAALTRGGMVAPIFAQPGAAIFGEGSYADADGNEWMMQAQAAAVVVRRNGRSPFTVALPTGVTISARCELIQVFTRVLLFRGTSTDPTIDRSPLAWSGVIGDAFTAIAPSETGTGTEIIPAADTAEVFRDQIVLPVNLDELIFSDHLDFTHFSPVFSQAKISKGTAERLVRILPFTSSSILVFKTRSIYALVNLVGDYATNAALEEVNRDLGCAARRSVAMVGGDAFFLSSTGVYRVQQVIQSRIQTSAVPVSDPIEPIIQRINWSHAADAVGAVFGRFYYLAVPLDSSTVNNVILVFDTTTNQWNGFDSAAFPLAVGDFRVHDFNGAKRLFVIDYVNARVLVMEEGFSDIIGGVNYPIADRLDTRGYAMTDPTTLKRWLSISAAISTWWPNYSIEVVADGVNKVQTLALNTTRDRRKYDIFGKADFNPAAPATVANDPTAQRRQDYSVDPTGGVYFDGLSGASTPGLRLDLRQERLERKRISSGVFRWLKLRITNTRGTLAVHSITLDGSDNARSNLRPAI